MRAGLCTVSAPLAACRIPAATALIPSARFLSLHLLTSPASTHQQTLYFVVDVSINFYIFVSDLLSENRYNFLSEFFGLFIGEIESERSVRCNMLVFFRTRDAR